MGTVNDIAAALRISGDDLDTDELTLLVGKRPTAAWRLGEARVTRSGRKVIARNGMWSLAAERTSTGDLDSQISGILEGVTSDLTVWKSLGDRYRIDLFCGLFLKNANEGICLSPQSLKSLGERGIQLDLDIYAPELRG